MGGGGGSSPTRSQGQVQWGPRRVSGHHAGMSLSGGRRRHPLLGAGGRTDGRPVAQPLDSPGGVQEEEEDGRQDEVITAHRPAPPEHHDPGHGWRLCRGSAGLVLTSCKTAEGPVAAPAAVAHSWPGVASTQAALPGEGTMAQGLPGCWKCGSVRAGPTYLRSSPHPQSRYKGPQQRYTGFGLTPEDTPAPKIGAGPLGSALPGATVTAQFR